MNKDQKNELIKQLEDQVKRFPKDKAAAEALSKMKGSGDDWEEQVKACKSKNELETLVKTEKQIDIDKRKKLKDLKAEALDL
jgi:hypothetical protein